MTCNFFFILDVFSESLVLLFRIEPNVLPSDLETTRQQLLKTAKKIGFCFFRDPSRDIFNEEDIEALNDETSLYPQSNYSKASDQDDVQDDYEEVVPDVDDHYDMIKEEPVPAGTFDKFSHLRQKLSGI